jgi:FixJ family two-component response regulator
VVALVVISLLNKEIATEFGTHRIYRQGQRRRVVQKMRAGFLAELVRMTEKLGISSPRD